MYFSKQQPFVGLKGVALQKTKLLCLNRYMHKLRKLAYLLSVLMAYCLASAAPSFAQEAGLNATTGQSVWINPEPIIDPHKLPEPAVISQKIDEAINDLVSGLPPTPPKIIFANTSFPHNKGGSASDDYVAELISQLDSTLFSMYAQHIPIVGACTGNDRYNAFTENQFVEHFNRSVGLLALTGPSITGVAIAQKPLGNPFDYYEAGRQLAIELNASVDPTKTNLIHMFGPSHGNDATIVMNGMKDPTAFTAIVPSYIKIIGAAANVPPAGCSFTVVNGTVNLSTQTIAGALIKGTFNIALNGENAIPTTTLIANKLTDITTQLGGSPDLLLYVPGHPAEGDYDNIRLAMINQLGSQVKIWGHEGGSEFGHLGTDQQPIALPSHFFLAGLKANDTPPPTSSPPPTGGPTPTPTAKPGDTDNDNDVDIFDYSTVLAQFDQTSPPVGGLSGDVDPYPNGDNDVDIFDFNLVVTNFGT